jgi:hypothetical protein
MMDPTREEQVMKRAAIVLGVAAALAVPATGSAANRIADKPQLKPQISRVMVAKPARATTARATTARLTVARASTARLTIQAYRLTLAKRAR